ncbi:unnamed protein product [Leptosia nina]|uniref:Uncharacterized protein n=1 Tax=Leptosia nina TaxID=320188 RepID=A0AAV1J3H9_9NEOP
MCHLSHYPIDFHNGIHLTKFVVQAGATCPGSFAIKYGFRCLAWACSKSDIRAIHTLCIGRKDSQVPSRGLLLVYPGEIGVVRARLKQVVVEGMHQFPLEVDR